ncbi:uncharacterized protein LOC143212123 [Lasioglossum baleicum]|uniref:uncharacterized protein LOC143212123 n=1 Tax=Lasioglossum baleicum TaxID=434251 RepID=UPI003FCED6CA
MPKYTCVVPDCKSNGKVPAHSFPKDPVRVLEWKKAICSPQVDELLNENLKHLRICALHFKEDDVIPTLVRRKLREDAVPSLLLPEKQHVSDKKNAPEMLDTHLREEMCVELPEDNTALNLQEEDKAAAAEFRITKRKRKNVHRKIRPSITPRAEEFRNDAEAWKRRQYNHVMKLKSFKRRLATANNFIKNNGLKKYSKLNPAQQLFLKMQLCNVDKKAKYKSIIDHYYRKLLGKSSIRNELL